VIIGVACEDDGHFSAVTYLVDAALLVEHTWLLDGIIDSCRHWCGLEPSEPWYKYDPRDAHDVRPVVLGGVRIAGHGHIRGKPLEPEAGMWRRVLLLFCHRDPRPDVVLLVRDMDGYCDRRKGMEQVRDGFEWPFAVVIAAPEPEIEAWHVAGFVPADAREREALYGLRRRLSFDPTVESHRLTSHPNDAATDAKRVLDALCASDRVRRQRCIADSSLLRQRGALNGLAAFLDEVDHRVVPLLGAASR
jgi:hypothetical protein